MIKETSGSGIKNEIISNKELAEELHKPSLETFRKEKYTHAAQKMKLSVKDFFSQETQSTGNSGFGHIYWRNP